MCSNFPAAPCLLQSSSLPACQPPLKTSRIFIHFLPPSPNYQTPPTPHPPTPPSTIAPEPPPRMLPPTRSDPIIVETTKARAQGLLLDNNAKNILIILPCTASCLSMKLSDSCYLSLKYQRKEFQEVVGLFGAKYCQ